MGVCFSRLGIQEAVRGFGTSYSDLCIGVFERSEPSKRVSSYAYVLKLLQGINKTQYAAPQCRNLKEPSYFKGRNIGLIEIPVRSNIHEGRRLHYRMLSKPFHNQLHLQHPGIPNPIP